MTCSYDVRARRREKNIEAMTYQREKCRVDLGRASETKKVGESVDIDAQNGLDVQRESADAEAQVRPRAECGGAEVAKTCAGKITCVQRSVNVKQIPLGTVLETREGIRVDRGLRGAVGMVFDRPGDVRRGGSDEAGEGDDKDEGCETHGGARRERGLPGGRREERGSRGERKRGLEFSPGRAELL